MSGKDLVILSVAGLVISGCAPSGRSRVHDYQTYASGKPKAKSSVMRSQDGFTQSQFTEYFENGRLKSEEWRDNGRPVFKLTFYENGQLQSEERYVDGQLQYGVYYSSTGAVERRAGDLSDWVVHQGRPPGSSTERGAVVTF